MPTSEHIQKKQTFDYSKSLSGAVYPAKPLDIEVFGYNHKKVADDLFKCLTESGFLTAHPLFRIRVDTMDNYTFHNHKTDEK